MSQYRDVYHGLIVVYPVINDVIRCHQSGWPVGLMVIVISSEYSMTVSNETPYSDDTLSEYLIERWADQYLRGVYIPSHASNPIIPTTNIE
jgi:hypothetical protein